MPFLLAFARLMELKRLTPDGYSNRSLAPIALDLAAIVGLYVTIRLMFIHRGLFVALPLLVAAGYAVISAILVFFSGIF